MTNHKSDWEAITPLELVPAVRHLREQFKTRTFQCSFITQKLAHRDLHPNERHHIADYERAFPAFLASAGAQNVREFQALLADPRKPSAIFKAYFDLFHRAMETEVRFHFTEFLSVGFANRESLPIGEAQWARTHLQFLIKSQKHVVELWIKNACDPLPLDAEDILWTKWRAPKLIYMQPVGNALFNPEMAWLREDEAFTKKLLDALSNNLVEFLDIYLENVVGKSHVLAAKRPQPQQAEPPIQSRAPKPITPVGVSRVPFAPKPTRPPLELPASYPPQLVARTYVVIGESIRKFPTVDHVTEMVREVVSKLAPYLVNEVRGKRLRSGAAIDRLKELSRYLITYNENDSNKIYNRELDVQSSLEWLQFASQLADLEAPAYTDPSVSPEPRASVPPVQAFTQPAAEESIVEQIEEEQIDKEADVEAWKEIEIVFVSEQRVQIFHNGTSETLNYAEFGFNDGRGGKPNMPWKVFAELAGNDGLLYKHAKLAAKWDSLAKHIEFIRKVLRQRFKLTSDPLPYIRKTGFKARFKVSRSSSYDM